MILVKINNKFYEYAANIQDAFLDIAINQSIDSKNIKEIKKAKKEEYEWILEYKDNCWLVSRNGSALCELDEYLLYGDDSFAEYYGFDTYETIENRCRHNSADKIINFLSYHCDLSEDYENMSKEKIQEEVKYSDNIESIISFIKNEKEIFFPFSKNILKDVGIKKELQAYLTSLSVQELKKLLTLIKTKNENLKTLLDKEKHTKNTKGDNMTNTEVQNNTQTQEKPKFEPIRNEKGFIVTYQPRNEAEQKVSDIFQNFYDENIKEAKGLSMKFYDYFANTRNYLVRHAENMEQVYEALDKMKSALQREIERPKTLDEKIDSLLKKQEYHQNKIDEIAMELNDLYKAKDDNELLEQRKVNNSYPSNNKQSNYKAKYQSQATQGKQAMDMLNRDYGNKQNYNSNYTNNKPIRREFNRG